MNFLKFLIITSPFVLLACESTSSPVKVTNQAPQTAIVTKRINTTECKDADDWYLDGYRVGKSFHSQKVEMLQQRMNFCHYTPKQLPSQFQTQWERGFVIGSQDEIYGRRN